MTWANQILIEQHSFVILLSVFDLAATVAPDSRKTNQSRQTMAATAQFATIVAQTTAACARAAPVDRNTRPPALKTLISPHSSFSLLLGATLESAIRHVRDDLSPPCVPPDQHTKCACAVLFCMTGRY